MNKRHEPEPNDLDELSRADQLVDQSETGEPIRERGHYVAGADGTEDIADDAALPTEQEPDDGN